MNILKRHKQTENIIVAGCGHFGCVLAAMLDAQGGNVTVIDSDAQAFSGLLPSYQGACIQGSAEDSTALELAGIRHADIVIAVTGDDNVNLMIAQIAKVYYHVPQVIARVQDDSKEAAYGDTGIVTICPTVLTLNTLLQSISDVKEGL